jgi:tetratricopeptide (TPR) repeat protein
MPDQGGSVASRRLRRLLLALVATLPLAACEPSYEEALAAHRVEEAKKAAAAEALRQDTLKNASSLVARGDEAIELGYFENARALYQQVYDVAPETPGLKEKLDRANREIEKLEAQRKAEEARAQAERQKEVRQALETTLRTLFLDQGLDIKVDVSGKNSDRLTLTYVLFTDVWNHRFDKEGLIDQWCAMGFKKITLRDGYDWGKIWTCGG